MRKKPIDRVRLKDKTDALMHCIKERWDEDVCGHLCDLLYYFGRKIKPSAGKPLETLEEIVGQYGKTLVAIEEK